MKTILFHTFFLLATMLVVSCEKEDDEFSDTRTNEEVADSASTDSVDLEVTITGQEWAGEIWL